MKKKCILSLVGATIVAVTTIFAGGCATSEPDVYNHPAVQPQQADRQVVEHSTQPRTESNVVTRYIIVERTRSATSSESVAPQSSAPTTQPVQIERTTVVVVPVDPRTMKPISSQIRSADVPSSLPQRPSNHDPIALANWQLSGLDPVLSAPIDGPPRPHDVLPGIQVPGERQRPGQLPLRLMPGVPMSYSSSSVTAGANQVQSTALVARTFNILNEGSKPISVYTTDWFEIKPGERKFFTIQATSSATTASIVYKNASGVQKQIVVKLKAL